MDTGLPDRSPLKAHRLSHHRTFAAERASSTRPPTRPLGEPPGRPEGSGTRSVNAGDDPPVLVDEATHGQILPPARAGLLLGRHRVAHVRDLPVMADSARRMMSAWLIGASAALRRTCA